MTAGPLSAADAVTLHGAQLRCPHAIVRNFLGRRLVRQLLQHVDREHARFVPAPVYRPQEHKGVTDAGVRNCAVLFSIEPFHEVFEPRILGVLGVALAKLGLVDRTAVAAEFEFCSYGSGGLFKPHHDVKPKGPPRIASCIYYFFRDPLGFRGGELRLYPWPGLGAAHMSSTPWVDVVPSCDSLVIFPSALRHEVRPVTCASGDWADRRFTVNCWAHRGEAKAAAPQRA